MRQEMNLIIVYVKKVIIMLMKKHSAKNVRKFVWNVKILIYAVLVFKITIQNPNNVNHANLLVNNVSQNFNVYHVQKEHIQMVKLV